MIRCWFRKYRVRQWERKRVTAGWRRLRGKGPSRAGAVAAAVVVTAGILGTAQGAVPAFLGAHGFRLVSRDQSCRIEWVPPQALGEETEGERYGIRINPARLEFQFYHERDYYESPAAE